MIDNPRFSYAPEGMGKEYVNQPRKPLSEYVGASVEFCAFPGAPDEPVAWDPMRFSELYKVSGNNPDVAWLREAELKHGRMSMLAITGVMVQSAGIHWPGNADISVHTPRNRGAGNIRASKMRASNVRASTSTEGAPPALAP